MSVKETNANKPLMRCRKIKDEAKTGVQFLFRDKFRRKPAHCLDGLRHKDGVTLIQAFGWNVGTCRCDAKGGAQVEDPREPEYRCTARGRSNP